MTLKHSVRKSVILDDFYVRENCDSGFIKEINSKMRVPDRISLDPNSLSRLNLPSTPTENDNMKVPERIVMSAANSQSSPSIAFNRRGDDLIDNLESITHQHALEPLPSSLVLNEINYPDLERLNIEKKEKEKVEEKEVVLISFPVNESQSRTVTPQSPPTPSTSNAIIECAPSQTNNSAYGNQPNSVDSRRIRILENRVLEVELELSRHRFIGNIFYVTLGGYLILKFLRSLLP
uniref:Mff-like domain-containing protein n=1 Tax=Trichobilharzia regenti TaxID=157069 RepID=A0AA85JBK0_TRIRE|nr:unnamed protein product [Trichobilharzia regenti]